MHPALALAPLTLAAVLVLSGLAKLPDPGSTHSMMSLLRLPRVVTNGVFARALPWIELGTAALLLTPWRWTYAAGAAAAMLLFLSFWAVIARAMGFEPRPSCGCFGRVGDHRVNGRTVGRNTLLVALALVAGWVAWRGHSATGLMAGFGAGDWLWLLLAVALAAVAVLVLGGGSPAGPTRAQRRATQPAQEELDRQQQGPAQAPEDDELDYVRRPIPGGTLVGRDHGTTTLPTLARAQAQLVVLVNCWCGPTHEALQRLPGWRERLPQLGVPMVFVPHPFDSPSVDPGLEGIWWDPGSQVYAALEAGANPAAVLLGADGLLAGGPVNGIEEIEAFVDEVADQLAEAGQPADA